jgi:hypothetical protein
VRGAVRPREPREQTGAPSLGYRSRPPRRSKAKGGELPGSARPAPRDAGESVPQPSRRSSPRASRRRRGGGTRRRGSVPQCVPRRVERACRRLGRRCATAFELRSPCWSAPTKQMCAQASASARERAHPTRPRPFQRPAERSSRTRASRARHASGPGAAQPTKIAPAVEPRQPPWSRPGSCPEPEGAAPGAATVDRRSPGRRS